MNCFGVEQVFVQLLNYIQISQICFDQELNNYIHSRYTNKHMGNWNSEFTENAYDGSKYNY